MQEELLSEIRQLRTALAQVLGTSQLPEGDQFSKEALDKASKEFQKLKIERGEWIAESDIGKYIKNAGYRAGNFIREKFNFTNYFKYGRTYFYNKGDLIALGKELKERNVSLDRYIEFIESRERFKKNLEEAKKNNKGKHKGKSFKLSSEVRDVQTSPAAVPNVSVIREDIKQLKEEFLRNKFGDYVDIYRNTYAMLKHIYYFEKYLEPGLKRRCRKWCDDFNYANNALKMITKKKEEFIPVKEDNMIQL
jgi:hypothetical protein